MQEITTKPCLQVSRNVTHLEHSRASFLVDAAKVRERNKQAVHRDLSRILVEQDLVYRYKAEGHVDPEATLTADLSRSGNTDSTSCSAGSLQGTVGRQVVSNR